MLNATWYEDGLGEAGEAVGGSTPAAPTSWSMKSRHWTRYWGVLLTGLCRLAGIASVGGIPPTLPGDIAPLSQFVDHTRMDVIARLEHQRKASSAGLEMSWGHPWCTKLSFWC